MLTCAMIRMLWWWSALEYPQSDNFEPSSLQVSQTDLPFHEHYCFQYCTQNKKIGMLHEMKKKVECSRNCDVIICFSF